MKRPVLLAVSFGTSYADSREKAIGAIEKKLEMEFPGYEVRRAFASRIIRKLLKEREGLEVDGVRRALEKSAAAGVESLLLQPLYVMSGIEYEKMMKTAKACQHLFRAFAVGKPLLSFDLDYDEVVDVMAEETRAYRDEKTAIVLMGHGTEHSADTAYIRLQERFAARGYEDFLIGTVESGSSLSGIKSRMQLIKAEKAVLLPFMIVAGDHAYNDMAGEKRSSWKNVLLGEGFEVECVIRGLGEYEGIRRIFSRHAREAVSGPLAGRQE